MNDHAIMDWNVLSDYKLGYVASPLPGDQRFTGMLTIPYLTRNGVASIKFRSLNPHQGRKYDCHSGTKHRLYNTLAFHGEPSETIGLTEGEVDAIVATEVLGIPSVGVPGVQHWDSRLWKPLFRDFQTVVILADGDEAGRDFGTRMAEELGWRALLAQCPDGEDVSSMAAQGRAAELRALYSTSNNDRETV